jgi:protein disulfide-isomerase A1
LDSITAFSKRVKRKMPLQIQPKSSPPLRDDTVVFLAYYGQGDERFRDQYKILASRYADSHTFIMAGPVKGHSMLHCVNNIDEVDHTAEAIEAVADLEAFVKRCSSPLIPELTRANEAEYSQTGKSLLHYFFSAPDQKEKYRADMRPLAKKYAEFLHFALTDVNEYPEMLRHMGLKPGSKTGLSLENPNTGEVFPYAGKGKVTPQRVEDFLNDVIDGKVRSVKAGSGGAHDEL